jgi:hypothetical protein
MFKILKPVFTAMFQEHGYFLATKFLEFGSVSLAGLLQHGDLRGFKIKSCAQ